MTDDLRARIAAALATCQGATTWAAMADAVMPEVQPIADDLAIAEQQIEAGNTETVKVYAQLRTAKAELTENEGVIKALRRQRAEAEAAVGRIRDKATEWTALAPADDWGMTPRDTVLADAGRYLLALIDRPERTMPNNPPASPDTAGERR